MTNDKRKNENKIIPHAPWGVHFAIAVILGAIGGYLVSINARGGGYGYYYTDSYWIGLFIFFVSVIFDILALKALITEAHVKALEVFYGRERAIKGADQVSEDK